MSTEDNGPIINGILWRNFYAKMFAKAMYAPSPDAREAYMHAIAALVELRRTHKERHGKSAV